jgi:predicted nuclease with TOPRIM domain
MGNGVQRGSPMAAVFAFILNNSTHDKNSNKLDRLHEQIGDLIMSLDAVRGFTEVHALIAAFEDFKKQLDAWGKGIERSLDEVREDVANMNSELHAMYAQLKAMQVSMTQINTTLDSMKRYIRDLNKKVDGLHDTVELNGRTMQQRFTAMQQRFAELQQSNTT